MMPAGLPDQRGPRKATISNQYIKPICSQYVMFLSFFICCSWIITAFYAFYMVSFRFRGNTMAFRLLWAWGWGWVEVVVGDGCFCKFQLIFWMIFPQNNRFMVSELSCFLIHTPSTSRLHCWKSPLVPPNKAPRHIFSAAHWWLHARSLRRWDNHFLSRTNYLVGGFNPSKKISQLGLWFPIYGKIKKCSKPPTSCVFFWGSHPTSLLWGCQEDQRDQSTYGSHFPDIGWIMLNPGVSLVKPVKPPIWGHFPSWWFPRLIKTSKGLWRMPALRGMAQKLRHQISKRRTLLRHGFCRFLRHGSCRYLERFPDGALTNLKNAVWLSTDRRSNDTRIVGNQGQDRTL